MTKNSLPPLNALKAFDIVGRTGSVAQAAHELNTSSSAISQQIRNLEKWLGIPLFHRTAKGLKLTDRGQQYFISISSGINEIATATDEVLGENHEAGTVKVSILSSFATFWLLPRLGDFINQYPNISIELITNTDLSNFATDDVDIAIRYGLGTYQGLVSEKILPDAVTAMCSPSLLVNNKIRHISDILQFPIIGDNSTLKGVKNDLDKWLTSHGIENPLMKERLNLSDTSLAIEAAKLGQGLILGRLSLCHDLLQSNTLVIPFDNWLLEPTSYYIVHSGLRPLRKRSQLFRNWLKVTAQNWLTEDLCEKVFSNAKTVNSN